MLGNADVTRFFFNIYIFELLVLTYCPKNISKII